MNDDAESVLIEAAQQLIQALPSSKLIAMYRRASLLLDEDDTDQQRYASTVRAWIFNEILERGDEPQLADAEGVCFQHWIPTQVCTECAPQQ
jgi:hypothetical protein